MARNPLLSSYRAGENRVTSSMLAVFERIDLSLLEALLAAVTGESALQMVSFSNQPVGVGASVPDARISAKFSFWFEVKTERHTLRASQLTEHLTNLTGDGGDEVLFVITPDPVQPSTIDELGDKRVVWFNFAALSEAIDNVVEQNQRLVSAQAAFLLRELQDLLIEDGLIDNDDVVVVAARDAYGEYLTHSAYVCQPGRSFREGLTHLGFYCRIGKGPAAIQSEIAAIEGRFDHVTFTNDDAASWRAKGAHTDCRVADLIEALLADRSRGDGEVFQVFLLSGVDEPAAVRLKEPIVNDTVSASGRVWAWTLGQRYTALKALQADRVTRTSQL